MSKNLIVIGYTQEKIASPTIVCDLDKDGNTIIQKKTKTFYKRDYSHRANCYCKKCKIQFEFTSYDPYDYRDLREDVVTCPSCKESGIYKDLISVDTEYCLYREWHINGDKITINFKNICYKFIKGNLFPVYFHSMVVMNLKTGFSYLFPTTLNGKKLKHEMSMYNCTYSNRKGWGNISYVASSYSDKCKTMTQLCEELYNYIREYKINNGLVNSYIPTFEQAFDRKLYNNLNLNNYRLFVSEEQNKENTKRGIINDSDFSFGYMTIFNRFPTTSPIISNNIFKVFDYNEEYKPVVKTRRQIKQNDKDIIKTILEINNVPTSKKNKQSASLYGMSYVTKFKKLNSVLSLDNVYKIINYLETSTIEVFCNSLKKYDMNDKTKNNLCNKIKKMHDGDNKYNANYIVYDTFHTLDRILDYDSDYKVNWRLSINELHDIINADFKKIKTKNHEIDYSELKKSCPRLLAGEYDGLKFELAKTTHELIDIGSYMSICVGSYDYRALRHDCYIVAVRDQENKPVICIELNNTFDNLKQVKLKYNATPDDELTDTVFKWCKDYGINPTCYDIREYKIDEFFNKDEKLEMASI